MAQGKMWYNKKTENWPLQEKLSKTLCIGVHNAFKKDKGVTVHQEGLLNIEEQVKGNEIFQDHPHD